MVYFNFFIVESYSHGVVTTYKLEQFIAEYVAAWRVINSGVKSSIELA